MRFLHTADIHIGKKLGEIPLLEDQRHILRQISDIASEKSCDAVLIAGDIYQNTAPSADAMEVFGEFLSELAEKDISVIAISGNHDSDQRVSYMSRLVRSSGIYMSERFDGSLQEIRLSKDERISFWLLPFIRPVNVRKHYPESEIATYNDAVRTVIGNTCLDTERVNVILAHQFITGSSLSDSEELSVGGIDNVDPSLFDGFDYVALGHLHRPQKAGRDCVRYSGSPLKYSISEAGDTKSCVIVDIHSKGSIDMELVPLKPLHDVREVKGLLNEIMNMPFSEDYVRVELNDEDVPPDARISIASVFPNMVRYAVINSKTSVETDVDISEELENKSVIELFCDFYSAQNNGVAPDERRLEIMHKVLEETGGAGYETD